MLMVDDVVIPSSTADAGIGDDTPTTARAGAGTKGDDADGGDVRVNESWRNTSPTLVSSGSNDNDDNIDNCSTVDSSVSGLSRGT